MNPIYEQIAKDENAVHEAVQKFIDAVEAFDKLNSVQKHKFCQEVCMLAAVGELINGVSYENNKG